MSQVSRLRNMFNNAATAGLNGQAAKMALNWVKSETPRKRRASSVLSGPRRIAAKKKATPYNGSIANQNSKSVREAAVKRGKTFKNKPKGGKRVKVPRKLKQQIQKVLAVSGHKGTWNQISYGQLFRPDTNSQSITYGMGNLGEIQSMFSWVDWLHMVSVMWGDKSDKQSGRSYADNDILGRVYDTQGGNSIVNEVALNGLQGHNQTPLTFTVYDSYETLHFKNNDRRTYTIELYLCAPKRPMTENDATVTDDILSGPYATTPRLGNPLEVWQNCVEAEMRTGVNCLGSTINDYGASPNNCPEFKRYFDVELTKIVLDPGQTYTYKVQGPKNLEVNIPKMFSQSSPTLSVALDLQKWSRCPIICLTADLVQARDGANLKAGRYTAQNTFNPEPIAVERNRHAVIICPDQVFGRIKNNDQGQATGILTASKKQTRYVRQTYTVSGTPGALYRVDEENPISALV